MKVKTLEEALKESRENKRKFIKEQIERQKKEEKKETILVVIISLFILTLTISCLVNLNKKDMNNCISAGHSQEYCERGL